jgi:N-acetylmuramoyl-L-alanine amidase
MPSQRDINLIVIHCSATVSGQPLRTAHETAAEVINRWHKARGFARQPDAVRAFSTGLPNTGYHYVIDTDGVAINGRALSEPGAHAKGYNAASVGICLVGGSEKTGRYTLAQWRALAIVVRGLSLGHGIPLQTPQRRFGKRGSLPVVFNGVCGHRDLSVDLNEDGVVTESEWLKTCPGFNVQEWLNRGLQPLPQHIFPGAPA